MRFSSLSTVLALSALQAVASPTQPDLAPRATPTVYLCGDSTMANRGANDGATDGWGQYFGTYSTVTVVNKAIGGRSARSLDTMMEARLGRMTTAVPTALGTGTETCISDKTGEVVYTFVFYVIQAAKLMTAKGATVVLSSQTPNNLWETGAFVGAPPRFVGYQLTAQKALSSSSVTFVDHFQAVANTYRKIGNSATNALYPRDHTHTSPQGASLVAQAFTQAIYQSMNGTTSLKSYIKNPPTVY
ncbi:hypothetical protein RRF57_004751 [Xylaria bambusicola]|uniref:SGNH hydrolase-type esterase domain-containing protein n=1 Tax=Xylaria bambusicola TaxID=326684 RepID=A0AAN7UPC5_9PEZI